MFAKSMHNLNSHGSMICLQDLYLYVLPDKKRICHVLVPVRTPTPSLPPSLPPKKAHLSKVNVHTFPLSTGTHACGCQSLGVFFAGS